MAYASPMNRAGYANQFDKEIAKMVYGKYMDQPKEFTAIANISQFPKGRTYTEAELSGLGALRQMQEGEAISYDVPAEGHKKSIQMVKFGLGFQRTEEMSDDELFGMSKKIPDSLSRAAVVCAETNFWNLFNNGFASETCWDGNYVFSATHTTLKSGTTISNLGSADLSPVSLEGAFEYFDNLVDEAGIKIICRPNKLVIPNKLKWVANDLLKATGRIWDYSSYSKGLVNNGSAELAAAGGTNQMNQFNPSNGIVDNWSIFVSHYLTDDDAWFLLSDQQDFRFMWGKQPTMSSSVDFDTDNTMFKLIMRFAVAVFDYKGAYGSPGA